MQIGKRKFCLSVQRKNHERKRWGYYPVRIPIKGGISVFKVSVPLSDLSSDQRTALLAQPPTTQPPIRSSSTQTPLLNSLLSSSSEPVVTTCTYVYVHIYTYIYMSICIYTSMTLLKIIHSLVSQRVCGCSTSFIAGTEKSTAL